MGASSKVLQNEQKPEFVIRKAYSSLLRKSALLAIVFGKNERQYQRLLNKVTGKLYSNLELCFHF